MPQGKTGIAASARIGVWVLLTGLLIAVPRLEQRSAPLLATAPVPNEPAITTGTTAATTLKTGPPSPLGQPVWISVKSSPTSTAIGTVRAFGRWFHEAFVSGID